MIDRVKELRQVHIDGDAIAFPDILASFINRMTGRPSRSGNCSMEIPSTPGAP
ncbi:MAG: hypothetical protein ABFD75_11425 [Smithella sp.]